MYLCVSRKQNTGARTRRLRHTVPSGSGLIDLAQFPTRDQARHDGRKIIRDTHMERALVIETANPKNYYEVISARDAIRRIQIDATLYLPADANTPLPVVIVVPGSLGIAPSHVRH